MNHSQLLESILNRGQSRLTIGDLIQFPVIESEQSSQFTPEERLLTFMDILETEEKDELWESGISTYQISRLKQYQAKSHYSLIESSADQIILKRQVLVCSICLKEIKELEFIRELKCGHKYHKNCIDPWLKLRATCPIDRRSMIE